MSVRNNFHKAYLGSSLNSFEKRDLRKTGIEIISDVPWGTHLCQFYKTREDLLDILVPYFAKGLEENEYCMWVTSRPLMPRDVTSVMKKAVPDFEGYLKNGQIEIIPYSEWYIRGGGFDENRVLKGWVDKYNKALKKGFSGLRLTGNTFWVSKKIWSAFADYEETINSVIGNYRMLAICTYSLDKCGANEVLDVANTHQFALIKREGTWRIFESSSLKESKQALRSEIEERKRIEESLRQSEQRYATTLASIGEGVIVTDVGSRIMFMNAVAEKLTGWEAKNALNRQLKEVFNLMDNHTRKSICDPAVMCAEKGKVVSFSSNIVLARKDGIEIPLVDSVAPIKDQNSKIVGTVLVFRDISQHKKAEEEILHLASFPNMSPDPVVELTFGGEVIYSNPTSKRLFPDLKKLGGKHPYISNWHWVVSHLTRNPVNDLKREVSVDGVVYLQTIQYISSMDVFRIYGSNISDRKQIEEVLRKSEARFEALYDANIIGMVQGDLRGNIYDVNDAFLSIIDYTREELKERRITFRKLTPSKYREGEIRAKRELLCKGVTIPWEKEFIKKDGSLTPVIIGEVLTNKDKKETIAFVLDITERKKLESRKDEFIGAASHELKTPITIIKAFNEILQRRFAKSKDTQNEYFASNINEQVDRLTKLINDLLDVSKIQAGKLKFYSKIFDIDKLIMKTVTDFQYITKTHSIETKGRIRRKIYGDEGRIHQVLVNLITNAIKYSPNGDKIIINREEGKDSVLIMVQDFGVGISESHRKKIFDRFYTGGEKEAQNIPGFGMGLYICKEIIKGHMGELWFESKKGKGSTFYFTLPLKK